MNPLYSTALFQAAPPPGGWPRAFAILTAWNPRGRSAAVAQNRQSDARLAARLRELGCWHWRVTGGSPDFRHAEPGFAAALPLLAALALGCEFEQEAIFWIENDELSVIACQGDRREELGSWRTRLARGNAVPWKGAMLSSRTEKNP